MVGQVLLPPGKQVNEVQHSRSRGTNSFLVGNVVHTNPVALVKVEGYQHTQRSAHAPSLETKPNWFVQDGLLERVLPEVLDHSLVMGQVLLWRKNFPKLLLQMSNEESHLSVLVHWGSRSSVFIFIPEV